MNPAYVNILDPKGATCNGGYRAKQTFRPSTDGFLGDLAGRKGGYHVGTVATS
jgi:hypothetical protein